MSTSLGSPIVSPVRLKNCKRHLNTAVIIAEEPASPTWRGICSAASRSHAWCAQDRRHSLLTLVSYFNVKPRCGSDTPADWHCL